VGNTVGSDGVGEFCGSGSVVVGSSKLLAAGEGGGKSGLTTEGLLETGGGEVDGDGDSKVEGVGITVLQLPI
jgi:hypothetical protein